MQKPKKLGIFVVLLLVAQGASAGLITEFARQSATRAALMLVSWRNPFGSDHKVPEPSLGERAGEMSGAINNHSASIDSGTTRIALASADILKASENINKFQLLNRSSALMAVCAAVACAGIGLVYNAINQTIDKSPEQQAKEQNLSWYQVPTLQKTIAGTTTLLAGLLGISYLNR